MATQRLATETLTHCPVCNALSAAQIMTHPDGYIPLLQLQRCAECGSIYLNPRLTLAATLVVEDESEVYNFPPEVIEDQIQVTLGGLVQQLAGHLRTPGRRLLDVGCNRGFFMEAARRAGWQVTGVEIGDVAANRARQDYGLTVYRHLTDLPATERFDLITAWHVLEHTREPVTFLRQAATHLAPDGILAIQVPAFDFVAEYQRRGQVSGILCSVHNFYFTATNLRTLLARAGLSPIFFENDPNTLFLTAIAVKPTTTGDRLAKAADLLQRGQWSTLTQEVVQFVRWRVRRDS